MSDNPSDEQRWVPPTSEDLPGGATPAPEGIPGTDEGQTQWGAPEAAQAGTYAPGGAQQSSGKATASLVLGILGLTFCPIVITSILAIVFGYSGRSEIDASGGRLGNRGMATAGIVLGWIGIALCALGILLLIILLIVGAAVQDSDVFDITTTTPSLIHPFGALLLR